MQIFQQLADAVINTGARQAIKFLSDKRTVKATRRLYNGRINKRDRRIEILFTIGTPNYLERAFIKQARKAGEPFPIKKIQLKFPPKH